MALNFRGKKSSVMPERGSPARVAQRCDPPGAPSLVWSQCWLFSRQTACVAPDLESGRSAIGQFKPSAKKWTNGRFWGAAERPWISEYGSWKPVGRSSARVPPAWRQSVLSWYCAAMCTWNVI